MSNIYVTEPPTNGKIVLHTTIGALDIELWSKECPQACRNFTQLCLEGYYNNTIFHRVIPNFIMQGGDPTGTGEGGDSAFGEPFADEFHQRLRFTRRGLVAFASRGKNTNASQFFITLDKTPELNRKHTIFGKVTGDTRYNILKANDLEIGENDKPIHPPKITHVDVLLNPYPDIKIRRKRKELVVPKKVEKKVVKKKNLALLSFADDEDEDEDEEEINKFKMQSFAKVVQKKKAIKLPVEDEKMDDAAPKKKRSKKSEAEIKEELAKAEEGLKRAITKERIDAEELKTTAAEEQSKLKAEISSLTKSRSKKRKKDKSEVSPLEQMRLKYLKRKKTTKISEADALKHLDKFKRGLEEPIDEKDRKNAWKAHTLVFEKEKDIIDPMAVDDGGLEVYDPLEDPLRRMQKKGGKSTKQSKHTKQLRATKKLDRW